MIPCWNVQGLKSKIGIPDFREALKGVDIFGVIETWTSEKDEIELDGERCVQTEKNKLSDRQMLRWCWYIL
jgi:hypothetical protein